MSRKRRPARTRQAVTVAVVALVLALVAVLLGRLLAGTLSLMRRDGSQGGTDPQFAEPAQTVTRPPELTGALDGSAWTNDPSQAWDLGVQTPVDKTAEELSREAAAAD